MAEDTKRRGLGPSTYAAILDLIREGVFSPGEPLREEDLATRLNVSRTPVREAMGRLQQKGLLQAAHGRGLAIATLSEEQVFELYAMRGELEALVARYAAQHATDAEIANLRRLNEQFGGSDEPKQAARLNRAFHARLCDAARNRYLRAVVEDLQETVALLPTTTYAYPGRTGSAFEEHARIIDAIADRDPSAAFQFAKKHIDESLATRLKLETDVV